MKVSGLVLLSLATAASAQWPNWDWSNWGRPKSSGAPNATPTRQEPKTTKSIATPDLSHSIASPPAIHTTSKQQSSRTTKTIINTPPTAAITSILPSPKSSQSPQTPFTQTFTTQTRSTQTHITSQAPKTTQSHAEPADKESPTRTFGSKQSEVPKVPTLSGVPPCARECFAPALKPYFGTCGIKIKCFCEKQELTVQIKECIPNNCEKSDQALVYSLFNKMCKGSNGFQPIVPPPA
ncbi:hypothetical protein BT63DRAFT_452522 [Microthyrium microscopicum]|uniref:CFEM domain-containing protein n=1 Tax=Microthyrium microscopicum TaxID=703497 RepID=A0A6A6UM82_9PEZI|nr:hypothetical protein BT63DRAFT_452522 [Microthyrium microscopicum]